MGRVLESGMRRLSDEAYEALTVFVDIMLVAYYDSRSDEAFMKCTRCDECDGHKDGCIIPTLLTILREEA